LWLSVELQDLCTLRRGSDQIRTKAIVPPLFHISPFDCRRFYTVPFVRRTPLQLSVGSALCHSSSMLRQQHAIRVSQLIIAPKQQRQGPTCTKREGERARTPTSGIGALGQDCTPTHLVRVGDAHPNPSFVAPHAQFYSSPALQAIFQPLGPLIPRPPSRSLPSM